MLPPWHDAIVEAAALWSDFASLQCFFEQVYHRMTLQALPTPFTDPVHTYFDDDVFRLGENEVFVNCGAYDGDTVRAFLEKSKGHFKKIYAVEPDKNNFAKLSATTPTLRRKNRDRERCRLRQGGLHFLPRIGATFNPPSPTSRPARKSPRARSIPSSKAKK